MDERLPSFIAAGADIKMELLAAPHALPLLAVINGNREHLRAWLPWVDHMQTEDDIAAYIQQCRQQHAQGTDLGFVIFYQGLTVGRIGIHFINQHNRSGAIGYWIAKPQEGKGIITRACMALLSHCFLRLGLNRVEIRCGTANTRSAAVPQRLGFTIEGVLRQAEWVNGHFQDLAVYSLLKEEWERNEGSALKETRGE